MTIKDRIYALRDRVLADRKFQRWASSLPVSRTIANRQTRALFDICAGFVYSQVLLACVRLRLFDCLADGPKTLAELALALGLDQAATERLLKGAVSLRLVELRGPHRYGLGVLGAAMLGNPSIGAMVEHHALLYADLHDPVALLKGDKDKTRLSEYWAYAGNDNPAAIGAETAATYSALMSSSQDLIADDILDAYPFQKHRCLLDVGGGEGRFLSAVGRRHPHMKLMMFDLPEVAGRARQSLANAGLGERAEVHSGSFFDDDLPRGADVATLVRILFDHPDPSALSILSRVRAALPDNGALVIAEPMSGDKATAPVMDAYFGFYLLSMGGGKTRTLEDFRQLLSTAGFSRVERSATRRPVLTGIVVARP